MGEWKKEEAKRMRKEMTQTERILWERLRREALGVKFRRQAVILGYIVDFWCPELRLVVEVDGSSHEGQYLWDLERDRRLAALGIRTVRVKAEKILADPDRVVAELSALVAKLRGSSCSPSGSPSLREDG